MYSKGLTVYFMEKCDIILKRSITFLADIKRAVFKNVELL